MYPGILIAWSITDVDRGVARMILDLGLWSPDSATACPGHVHLSWIQSRLSLMWGGFRSLEGLCGSSSTPLQEPLCCSYFHSWHA